MIGYKGFDKDFRCRDMQYEVGKTYIEKEAKLCEKGLHFCENPLDVFAYYSPADGKFAEIEADDVSSETGNDSKRVARKLTVKTEINLFKLVKLGVEYIKAQVDWDNNKATNTGNRSAAIVDGKESVAVSLGAKGRAKGNVGCWIVLAEWDSESRRRIDVKSFYVDGEKVKANTFYMLRDGELVEYSDET